MIRQSQIVIHWLITTIRDSESLTKLKGTFDQLFDLSEFMAKKASIGDVSKVDTGFEAGKLDASGVMV